MYNTCTAFPAAIQCYICISPIGLRAMATDRRHGYVGTGGMEIGFVSILSSKHLIELNSEQNEIQCQSSTSTLWLRPE